jgi:hypothetical protein
MILQIIVHFDFIVELYVHFFYNHHFLPQTLSKCGQFEVTVLTIKQNEFEVK